MMSLFGAMLGAKIHAFFTGFGLLIGAGVCVAGAFTLLSLPNVPIVNGIKRGLAYVLFGVAIGLMCWFGGYWARGRLEATAELRRIIDTQTKIIEEKDRQAKATEDEREYAAKRAVQAEEKNASLQNTIQAFERQERRVDTKTCSCNATDPDFDRSVREILRPGARRKAKSSSSR